MTPEEHFTQLEAENRQQREQIAVLLERVRDSEVLRTVGEEDEQAFRQGESLVRAMAVSDEPLRGLMLMMTLGGGASPRDEERVDVALTGALNMVDRGTLALSLSYAAPGSAERLTLHVIPTLGKVALTKLTAQQVQRLYTAKLEEGLSSTTVRHLHAVLHRALGLNLHPAAGVRRQPARHAARRRRRVAALPPASDCTLPLLAERPSER